MDMVIDITYHQTRTCDGIIKERIRELSRITKYPAKPINCL